jgi:hypothetical protein
MHRRCTGPMLAGTGRCARSHRENTRAASEMHSEMHLGHRWHWTMLDVTGSTARCALGPLLGDGQTGSSTEMHLSSTPGLPLGLALGHRWGWHWARRYVAPSTARCSTGSTSIGSTARCSTGSTARRRAWYNPQVSLGLLGEVLDTPGDALRVRNRSDRMHLNEGE